MQQQFSVTEGAAAGVSCFRFFRVLRRKYGDRHRGTHSEYVKTMTSWPEGVVVREQDVLVRVFGTHARTTGSGSTEKNPDIYFYYNFGFFFTFVTGRFRVRSELTAISPKTRVVRGAGIYGRTVVAPRVCEYNGIIRNVRRWMGGGRPYDRPLVVPVYTSAPPGITRRIMIILRAIRYLIRARVYVLLLLFIFFYHTSYGRVCVSEVRYTYVSESILGNF